MLHGRNGYEYKRSWVKIILGFNMLRGFLTDLLQKPIAMCRHFCPNASKDQKYKNHIWNK